MASSKREFKFLGSYIDGRFALPTDPNGHWADVSPADLNDTVCQVTYSYQDIDRAVAASRKAFKSWKSLSSAERGDYLKKYQEALKRHQAEIAEAIAREVGKPLWESQTEVTTMINKVDVTLQESMDLIKDYEISNIMPETTGVCRYKPHGVMVVVGPFNFPGHLPNGHIVPALAAGNTVIFKPSEKAPIVGQLMAQCFEEAGLPPGVFNVLQGERELSRRLVIHEEIDGILFTGSYEVGLRIKQDTLQQYWKILALEMGGKNAAIVWDDCDVNVALRETILGAYQTAGQRCSCTSRVIISEKMADMFIQRYHEIAKTLVIGHPLDNPFMGPVIDHTSQDRYMKFLGIAAREGCEVLMRGKPLELDTKGYYVAPSICRVTHPTLESTRKSVYQQTEIFGPNVVFLAVKDFEEAIAYANETQYGLACAVFTKSKEKFVKATEDLDMGVINWNRATAGASSRLPFGGVKKSGNHWPTAKSATLYCAYPVASLESENPGSAFPQTPGITWKS